MRKNFIFAYILTAILLFSIAGVVVYQQKQIDIQKQKIVLQKSLITPTPTPALQSLKSDDYQFEFSYPFSWKLENRRFITPSGNYFVNIISPDTTSTLKEFLAKVDKIASKAINNGPSRTVSSSKNIILNGQDCIQRQELQILTDTTAISTYCKVKNAYVVFTLEPAPGNLLDKDLIDYEHILSSFKYSDSKLTTDISTWKTYKFEQYSVFDSFIFKYPPSGYSVTKLYNGAEVSGPAIGDKNNFSVYFMQFKYFSINKDTKKDYICFNDYDCIPKNQTTKLLVGSEEAWQYDTCTPEPGGCSELSRVRYVVIAKGDKFIVLSQQYDIKFKNDFLNIFDQILSTFQFTN